MTKGNNSGDWNSGYWNTGDFNTGDWNSGDWNTGYCNTGNRNTGNRNTGDWNTGYFNTGNMNTGNRNTGNRNTGYCNTGDWNSGDWNTGYCNTITPDEILVFNKMCKVSDWNEASKPNWMHVDLCSWIYEIDMSDKEKDAYPSYATTGGYLKCYNSLHDAFKESWDKATKEDKLLTFNLPNFDAEVFEEIFGFHPENPE